MNLKGLLSHSYKNIIINNENIFLRPFPIFLNELVSNKLDYLLKDNLVRKYIFENINYLVSYTDDIKIFLLNQVDFSSEMKTNDIVSIISSLENDEDKINLLLNENIQKKVFTTHYLAFSTLNINLKKINNYKLLLDKLNNKQKIIILKGIENEDFVANYIENINFNNQTELMYILRGLKKDENKIKFLDILNDHYKAEIISSLNDSKYIFDNIDLLIGFYKLDFLKKQPDEVKIKFIENNIFKEELIASLNNEVLLFKYFMKNKDYKFQRKIIENVKNDILKYALFEKMEILSEKYFELILYLLNNVKDTDIKRKLTILLRDDGLKKVIESNTFDNEKIINNMQIDFKPYVDDKITIGIELECSHNLNTSYILIGNLLKKWNLKREETVTDGVEITSRILNYTEKDMKELKYVCDFLNNNGFKKTNECGGHIHIGFDYFKNIYELQMFYYLYIHCEEILYLIFNEKGTMVRSGVSINAFPIKEKMLSYFGPYMEVKANNIYDMATIIGSVQQKRYAGLNILNFSDINKKTIELRIPNGTINYDELNLNIILFTRLIEKGKYFANNPKKEYLKDLFALSKDIPIEDKKDILLDLLFDNDIKLKNKYYDRFEENIKFYKQNVRTLKK